MRKLLPHTLLQQPVECMYLQRMAELMGERGHHCNRGPLIPPLMRKPWKVSWSNNMNSVLVLVQAERGSLVLRRKLLEVDNQPHIRGVGIDQPLGERR